MRKDKQIVIEALLDCNMENGIDESLCFKLADDYQASFEEVLELAKSIYKCKKFNGELKGKS